MRSLILCFVGSAGVWAVDASTALSVLIAGVTIYAILYEKSFFKNKCLGCWYYRHYIYNSKGGKNGLGNNK